MIKDIEFSRLEAYGIFKGELYFESRNRTTLELGLPRSVLRRKLPRHLWVLILAEVPYFDISVAGLVEPAPRAVASFRSAAAPIEIIQPNGWYLSARVG